MKKKIFVLVLIIALFCMTACSKKSKESKESESESSVEESESNDSESEESESEQSESEDSEKKESVESADIESSAEKPVENKPTESPKENNESSSSTESSEIQEAKPSRETYMRYYFDGAWDGGVSSFYIGFFDKETKLPLYLAADVELTFFNSTGKQVAKMDFSVSENSYEPVIMYDILDGDIMATYYLTENKFIKGTSQKGKVVVDAETEDGTTYSSELEINFLPLDTTDIVVLGNSQLSFTGNLLEGYLDVTTEITYKGTKKADEIYIMIESYTSSRVLIDDKICMIAYNVEPGSTISCNTTFSTKNNPSKLKFVKYIILEKDPKKENNYFVTKEDTFDGEYSIEFTVDNSNSGKTESKDNETASTSNEKAVEAAKDWLELLPKSREGLIKRLEADGYTKEEAKYGADHCGADWKANALRSAKDWLETLPKSYSGLITRLEADGYTKEEAKYGADNCGADWKANALAEAKDWLEIFPEKKYDDIKSHLTDKGFTAEEAKYGADKCGAKK